MRTPYVPQLGDVDCGPACLTSVLAAHGRHVRVSEVARACGTGRDGTSARSLSMGAAALGLQARTYRPQDDADPIVAVQRAGLPAIALMRGHHFVVVEGVDRRGVRLNDPGQGHRTVGRQEFVADWMGLGIALTPGPSFTRGGTPPIGPLRAWWRGEDRRARLLLAFGIVFAVLTSAAGIGSVFLVRSVASGGGPAAGPAPVALATCAVVAWAAGWASAHLRSRLLHHTVTRRSTTLVRHLLRVRPAFLQHRFSGEVAMRPQRVDGAAMQIVGLLVDGVVGVLTVGAALAAVAHTSASAALIVVAGLAVTTYAIGHGLGRYREVHRRAVAEQQRRDGEIVATLTSIETLRAEADPTYLADRWSAAQQRVSALEHEADLMMLRRTRLSLLADAATTALVLYVCHTDDVATPQTLVVALLTGIALSAGRRVVGLGAFDLTQVDTALRLVDDVLIEPRQDGLAPPDGVDSALVLDDVSYGRPGARNALFTDVRLRVEPGRTCFLAGASGVGKSTLARIAVGALPATSGTVLRPQAVAYVPQRATFLEGSVLFNLTFGRRVSAERVTSALRLVEMDAVVAARGGAAEAAVTQGGRNFSGGERQRLALARALLTEPELLVLDESFSAMDDHLTDVLYTRIRVLGLPVLSVAHHLPPLQPSDLVLRLTRGGLAEDARPGWTPGPPIRTNAHLVAEMAS